MRRIRPPVFAYAGNGLEKESFVLIYFVFGDWQRRANVKDQSLSKPSHGTRTAACRHVPCGKSVQQHGCVA